MRDPEGESDRSPLRPCFDRRLKLEFHGSRVTSDAGLLAYRELDDALGLTVLASDVLADSRTGKNGWHGVVGLLRQSVFGRLAGYEDVNDADRLGRDPAMRWVVGRAFPPNFSAVLVRLCSCLGCYSACVFDADQRSKPLTLLASKGSRFHADQQMSRN